MTDPIQYTDFGEKIGGARKDLWNERGLYAADLSTMNEREAAQYVKKDNIWKKPDYQALIDGGLSIGVAYFVKKIRDNLIVAPRYLPGDDTPEKRLARQAQYIETIRSIQAVVEAVRTPEDAIHAFQRILVDGGYVRELSSGIDGPKYGFTEKAGQNPVITSPLANLLVIRSVDRFNHKFTDEARSKQFGVPKEERMPNGYQIQYNDGKYTYSQNNDWKPGTYYVTKGYRILQKNLESRKAALEWARGDDQRRRGEGKKRFVPRQLSRIQRDGPDYRGGRDVTGQDYLDTFGFRGGEFGNWMGRLDRRASLSMGFDALKDLAAALQISDRDISYQGTLAIAFGARGSGNAAAHYEPMRKVINLTKMHGAGALAHEWWHGLDDFLGQRLGIKGYVSEKPRAYPPFQKLMNTIKYKPATPEQAAQMAQREETKMREHSQSFLDSEMLPSLKRSKNREALNEYDKLKTAFLNGEPGITEKLEALYQTATGKKMPRASSMAISNFSIKLQARAQRTEARACSVETDYYRESKRMGREYQKDGGYWESDVELTARAFATYIMDKLPYRSDYLDGHAECAVALATDKDGNIDIIKAYPQGEERAAINTVFDEIIADLKRQHYLTHEDRAGLDISEAEKEAVAAEYERLSSALSPQKHTAPQR